jgi:hypothetical protein
MKSDHNAKILSEAVMMVTSFFTSNSFDIPAETLSQCSGSV